MRKPTAAAPSPMATIFRQYPARVTDEQTPAPNRTPALSTNAVISAAARGQPHERQQRDQAALLAQQPWIVPIPGTRKPGQGRWPSSETPQAL